MGNPSNEHRPTPREREIVESMAGLGIPQEDIALILGIAPKTLRTKYRDQLDKGMIKATFAYDVAPHTIESFIALANEQYYDGTVFHRIIKGFMIQGGDSLGSTTDRAGSGGPGFGVVQEFSRKPHLRGVLSMARQGGEYRDPTRVDSAGGQFFIMHADQKALNSHYTAFGQVIDGMDVVDKIAETPTHPDAGGQNNGSTDPKDRPVIKAIRILPATAEMYGIK